MDDFTSSLVQKFNLRPKYIKKLKYMYICNTNKGNKLIKPLQCDTENILFIHNLKKHLIQKDFKILDTYHLGEDGLPYILNEGIPYVMTDYLSLDECDLSNINNVKSVINTMSNFHNLSQGMDIDISSHKANSFDILNVFEKKLGLLMKMKRQVSKQKNLTDFELIFIKNYNLFYTDCIDVLNILNKYSYKNIETICDKKTMICHNKIKEDNFLFAKDSHLINFENATIDHFVYDLSSFILRYIRKQGSSCLTLEEILHIYAKNNHIDGNILPILYAIIKFPNRYIDTCKSCFERRRNFIPIGIASQIDNIVALKDFHESFISPIKPY